MQTQQAQTTNADDTSVLLGAILRSWSSDREFGADFIRAHYINHPESLACTLAVDQCGTLLGFQSLKRVAAGNTYNVAPGWGVIGTYVGLDQARRGVGKALFRKSLSVARSAGVSVIDATISKANTGALAYYDAQGFRTYNELPSAVQKRFDL